VKERGLCMKIGLIGCGGMGTTHNLSLKALSGKMDVEVTALADCRQEFLERAAKQWPGAKTYTTGMELLREEELDAVHICLPSYLHAEHAIAAMEKGMDVFLEKPVCLTREDCSRLLEVQKKTGARVMVGQVVRSFGEYRYLKDIYEKKTFGKLKSIVMQRISGDTKWGYEDWFHEERKSGSVVLDLHIHDLDFLRYMLGEPDSFTVKAAAFPGGMINQIITSYQFGSVFATAEGIWDVCTELPFEGSFRACFEEATIIYQGRQTPTVQVYHKGGEISVPVLQEEISLHDETAGINISDLGPYYTEIKYFYECLAEDREITRAPLEEGIKSVLLGIEEWEAGKKYIKEYGQ